MTSMSYGLRDMTDDIKEDYFVNLLECLIEASGAINDPPYFQVDGTGKVVVDGGEPIYRERVYCYELYHQLRYKMEIDPLWDEYELAGDLDKIGYSIITGKFKPDLLFMTCF